MKLLLDTHFLIWAIDAPDLITTAERVVMRNHAASTWVSVVSIWEVRIKWETRDRHGRRKGRIDPATAMTFARNTGMALADLDVATVVEPLASPVGHRDPFDDMLLTHAQQLGARLLTRDGKLRNHPLALSA